MLHIKYRLLLWGILCFFSVIAQPQGKILDTIPIIYRSDDVLKISTLASTVPAFVLTPDRIKDLGALDLGDAIEYVPGVQLKDYGGIGGIKTVSYRSLNANHTTIIQDGNVIPNTQNGVINLSSFSLIGAKSIVFSTGENVEEQTTASAYLQANSISLNSRLNSKPQKLAVNLYSTVNTVNAYEHGALFQVPLKRFFVGAEGVYRHGSGEYDFRYPIAGLDEVQRRQNAALSEYRLRATTGFQGNKHKITLSGAYRNNAQELPGAVVLYNPSNDQELWNEDLAIRANHLFKANNWKVHTHASFQENYTRYYDPGFLNVEGFIDNEYKQKISVGGFLINRVIPKSRTEVFLGGDLLNAELESSELSAKPNRFQLNSVLGFGQRLFKHHLHLKGNVSAQMIEDDFVRNDLPDQQSYIRFSPFVSVSYLPFKSERFRVRAFYKRTFRMPTFNDLYYNFIGNYELDPEEANLFNVGLTFGKKWGRMTVELSADTYYNKVWNRIVAIPTKDIFNWSMQNIGLSDAKGVDLAALVQLKFEKVQFILNTSQSFNQTLDKTNPNGVTYNHQLPYTPTYSGNYGVAVIWKKFRFTSNLLHNGSRYSLNENIYANYLPDFTDWNVGLARSFELKKDFKAAVDFKVMNLLNVNYEIVRSFPMPGRYYQLTLRLER
jgi:outer membrane cobalamin receptor